MKKFLSVLCLAAATTFAQAQQDLSGNWQGTLKTPNKDLRIIVKVDKGADGKLTANMYSIDQTPQPFKPSAFTFAGNEMSFLIPMIDGSYKGKLAADGKTINGTWSQGGTDMVLVLDHAEKSAAWDIPAPPPPPKNMPADADPSFEVATIKPNDTGASQMQSLFVNNVGKFGTRASSVIDLISFAYDVQAKQIIGGPEWASSYRFDIEAKPDVEGMPNPVQLRSMIRKFLVERFDFKFHNEKREMSAFVLRVAKGGQKMEPSTSKLLLPGIGFNRRPDGVSLPFNNVNMHDVSTFFQSLVLDRPVVDQTAVEGRYNFVVSFTPDETMFNGRVPGPQQKPADGVEPAPSLFEALQQQAGLKLTPEKTQVDVIAIDHIEKPSAN